METHEEIGLPELQRYAPELREAVDAVCSGSAFRNSPKSCEFLRHIVHRALEGDTAELKERLIGMNLLGREASYDTGSDAGVRVRANDVRKRLIAHNEIPQAGASFTFELPVGSYVPRFFHSPARSSDAHPLARLPESIQADEEPAPPLSLLRLAAPTLVALFLCTICLRWQISQEQPFNAFWQNVFENHRVTLYLRASQVDRAQGLVGIQELEAVAPLLNLAGQFHTRLNLTTTLVPSTAPEQILISIGPVSGITADPEARLAGVHHLLSDSGDRLTVENTPAGREILEPNGPVLPVSGSAALLTIANGTRRSIDIDGTDGPAIRTLIGMLCVGNTFPKSLEDSFQDGTVTQIVFPMSAHAETRVFHELLPTARTEIDRAP
jgi:hypothetical protein